MGWNERRRLRIFRSRGGDCRKNILNVGFVYPTAESRSDVGQVSEKKRSFYRKHFYIELIEMRYFTPLAIV